MEVYQVIQRLKAATNKEISTALGMAINQITPRTNELVKVGFVKEGQTIIQTNNRKAIQWVIS
jgi:hypothetical protein